MGNRKKKMMTTTHDEEILQEFKIACIKQGKRYNEVIDDFMRQFIEQTKNTKRKEEN